MHVTSATKIVTRPLLRGLVLGLGVAALAIARAEAEAGPGSPAVTTLAAPGGDASGGAAGDPAAKPGGDTPGGDKPAGAAEKPADGAAAKSDVVRGKLTVREVGKDEADKGAAQFVVRVGDASIVLEGVDAKAAAKLNGKFVSARGRLVSSDAGPVLHVIAGNTNGDSTGDTNGGLAAQDPAPVAGVLGTEEGEKTVYRLTAADGTVYVLPASANAKAKPLLGKHVEVVGMVMSGPKWSSLESVTDVRRKLLPTEREPKDGEEAITGRWTGKLVAVNVPSGAPNVKSGDTYDFAFHIPEDRTKTTGRLLATYDIDGARLQKFKPKDRSARLDLSYTFGKGSYPVRLEGTFSEDWKTFTGEWSASFLGSGTFEVGFKVE